MRDSADSSTPDAESTAGTQGDPGAPSAAADPGDAVGYRTLASETTPQDADANPADGAASQATGQSSTATQDGCSFVAAMDELSDSVFQLHVVDGRTQEAGTGTAFYLGDGEFMTAEHLVRRSRTVRLRNAGYDVPAVVAAVDRETDVALLVSSPPQGLESLEALSFRDAGELRPGQEVASVGYPLTIEERASIAEGLISRLTDHPDYGPVVQTDAPINLGSSGGPLIDECGRVVGMIIAKWYESGVEGTGWALSSSVLMSQLESMRAQVGSQDTTADAPLVADIEDPPVPDAADVAPGARALLPEAPENVDHYLLREVDDLLRFYISLIDSIIDQYNRGQLDGPQAAQAFRTVGVDLRFQGSILASDYYDLSAEGLNCDLARLGYADAFEWTYRRLFLLAAQATGTDSDSSAEGAAWDAAVAFAQQAADDASTCRRLAAS